jgi:hypothetical protein
MRIAFLEQLIQSLTPHERRYLRLKLKAERRGDVSNLEDLFVILENSNPDDPSAVQKAIATCRFAPHERETRYQLYRRLLEWLQTYHQGHHVEDQLHQYMQHANLLFQRGLHEQVKAILSKAWNMAAASEQFLLQLEVIQWIRKLMAVNAIHGEESTAWVAHEAQTLRKLNNLHAMQEIYLQTVQAAFTVEYVRCENDLAQLNRMFAEALNLQNKDIHSESARLYQLKVLAIYHRAAVDFEQLGTVAEQLLERFESRPEFQLRFPDLYMDVHIDICYVTCFSAHGQQMVEMMTKMESISPLDPWHRRKLFTSAMMFRINICSFFGAYEAGITMSELLIHKIAKVPLDVNEFRQFVILFNAAHCAFGAGDLRGCLKYLRQAHAIGPAPTRLNIYCMAQVLYLIVHFELGNDDVLPYAMRSLYRFLKKRNRIFEFEKAILKFLRKQLGHNPPTLKNAFQELHLALLPLRESRFEIMSILSFDIVAWLESKLGQGDFRTIVRRKASHQSITIIDQWIQNIQHSPPVHLIGE